MKLVLDYFNIMTGGHTLGRRIMGRYGVMRINAYHRFILGFVPHAAALGSETSASDFRRLITSPYPLAVTPAPTTVVSKANKYPTILLANETGNLANVILSTDLWEFFVEDSSETVLGIPNGTPTSNSNIDAVIFNGAILTSHPLNGSLWYGAINATPSWTATSGSVTTGITHVLKPFQDVCFVLDSSGGSLTRRDLVKVVASDYSMTTGFTLGDSFDAQDIGIFQERSVLIFCQNTTSPRLQRSTIVFVWDGVPGNPYDQKITLRGMYRCSIERDGIVYVFTQVGTTLVCYAYDGTGFKEIGSITNTVVSTIGIPKSRIAIEENFFVILASAPGNVSATVPLYWNPGTGEAFFLTGPVNGSFAIKNILIAQDTTGAYARYGSFLDTGGTPFGYLVSFPIDGTTRLGNAAYKSNLIPAPEVKGVHDNMPMGRMSINHIEIEYNAPPPTSSDAIVVSLITRDAFEADDYETDTGTVKDTTANSTNAAVDDTRAIIQIGRDATELEIDLAVTLATSSWDLVIKRIIVDFEPIALQT